MEKRCFSETSFTSVTCKDSYVAQTVQVIQQHCTDVKLQLQSLVEVFDSITDARSRPESFLTITSQGAERFYGILKAHSTKQP